MSLADVISGVVAVQKTIPGVAHAYDNAPEAINEALPAFITSASAGSVEWPREPGVRTITHEIVMDLFVNRGGDLSAADKVLKPFVDQVIETFDQNITLNGTCLNSGGITYKFGKLTYAGVEYLGIKFTLKAVELNQVVYKG